MYICECVCVYSTETQMHRILYGRRGFLLSYPLTACRLLFKWHLLFVEPNFVVRIFGSLSLSLFYSKASSESAIFYWVPQLPTQFLIDISIWKFVIRKNNNAKCQRERKREWEAKAWGVGVGWVVNIEWKMMGGEFSIMDITSSETKQVYMERPEKVSKEMWTEVRAESPWYILVITGSKSLCEYPCIIKIIKA